MTNSLKHEHTRYPRFFVRKNADGSVHRLAKAETADAAAQYTVDAGWQEYGVSMAVRGVQATVDGHTAGFSAEGETQETRLWRTLVSVHYVTANYLWLKVPAWDSEQTVRLNKTVVPLSILDLADRGQKHFHARVNIGAEHADDLRFHDWEDE